MSHQISGRTRRHRGICLLLLLWIGLPVIGQDIVPAYLMKTMAEIPEAELLDVCILVFDPGLPEGDENAKEDKGVFAELRKMEARNIPVSLMDTLQMTGYWGAVRVVPEDYSGGELRVTGLIKHATGFRMTLEIRATDSTGKQWFKKKYKQFADPRAYNEKTEGQAEEPFRFLYNRIANDLLKARQEIKPKQLQRIRQVNDLRFAQDFAPDAFNDYIKVKEGRRTRYKINKLPSETDPMIARIGMIRERDEMLVDSLTAHYQDFSMRAAIPYGEWLKYSYEEEKALRKAKRAARLKKILGALAIVGAVTSEGKSRASNGLAQVSFVAGIQVMMAGFQQSKGNKIHAEALKELAASMGTEVAPILVEMEGRTHTLTGSAEAQYANWRKLLRELHKSETGLPQNLNKATSESEGGE